MNTEICIEAAVIILVGGLGGIVNALLSDGGFRAPQWVQSDNGRLYVPGWLGNVVIGAAAAVILWGLYGAPAHLSLSTVASSIPGLTVADVTGGFLSGIGGSRLVKTEVDKRLLAATKESLTTSLQQVVAAAGTGSDQSH